MAQLLDSLMESVYSMAKKSATDYCSLETTLGPRTFVFRSGTLATVLRYHGISRIMGPEENAQVVQSLAKWKRLALKRYEFNVGKGLLRMTKSLAARPNGIAKALELGMLLLGRCSR